MSDTAAKMWYLKNIDLFSHLDEDEMEKLSQMTQMQDVPAEQPIYFPGDASDTVYMLKKGRVRLSRSTPDGRRITLAIVEDGEIFGEMALAGEDTREVRAETMDHSFLCAASRERFLEFVSSNPDLNLQITRTVGDRRREIEARIENLIFQDGPTRLANLLQDLFEEHSDESEEGPRIKFSHQDIADLIGLSRPTTTQLLNKFQKEGWIELGRKQIVLKDPIQLKQRASTGT